jgi:hypothetical protein
MTGRPMNWRRQKFKLLADQQYGEIPARQLNRRAWAEFHAWEQSLNKHERRRLRLMDRYASGQPVFAKAGDCK